MKNVLTLILILFSFLIGINKVAAQTQKIVIGVDSFEKKWVNQKFPIDLLQLKEFNGKQLNPNYNSLVVFGFHNCIPCRKQMPALVTFADTVQKLNVIYISFDAIELINDKLKMYSKKEIGNSPIIAFSLSEKMLDETGLVSFGYPIKYYIDTKHIIYNIDTYTDKDFTNEQLHKKWYEYAHQHYLDN